MMKQQDRKLSTSFLYPIVLTVFIILMLLTIYDAFDSRRRLIDELNANADHILDISAAAAADALWSYNDVSLYKIGDAISNYQEVAYVTIRNEKNEIVYEKRKRGQNYQEQNLYPEFVHGVFKEDIRLGEIRLGFTSYFLTQKVTYAILGGVIKIILVNLCILLLILFLSRNITASLDNVVEGVKAFAKGDRSSRIFVKNNHEIKQLADRINHMFDVIIDTDEKLKENYVTLQNKEEALRITEERYRYAVEGSNDAVWDYNLLTDEYYISLRGTQMIGLSENEEITLALWSSFVHPEDSSQFEYFLDSFRQKPASYHQIQFRMIGSKGDIHWVFCRGKGILDQNKQLVRISGFYTDITERKKAEEAINHLAYYDVLTGLPNRAMLYEHINKIFMEQHRMSSSGVLIFLDLDDFKTINDTQGHMMGDQVLVSIAKDLEAEIKCDAIARIGGDEFVVVKKDCDIDTANKISNDIINIIREPRVINGHEFVVSCSMGIAIFPEDGTEIGTLLMKADSAMYQAKKQGKDQYKFYEQSINDQIVQKVKLQNEIRQGIANGEFVLYYQPQVNMITGSIIGVEALVRWLHPVLGVLPPSYFISIAEETGLIIPLGETILRTACRQSAEWEKSGYTNISMSVNISAKQINKKNIINDILRIIEETQMRPELLVLEITESIAMENIENTVEIIHCLKEKGISFSMDDFGTGYSSLNYLKNIPINHLKIDKQFVQSLHKQMFEEMVVKAIIEIAHSMKLIVVAEGIETLEQREILIKYRCDLAQGYYFSRPLPTQAVEAILRYNLPTAPVIE